MLLLKDVFDYMLFCILVVAVLGSGVCVYVTGLACAAIGTGMPTRSGDYVLTTIVGLFGIGGLIVAVQLCSYFWTG